MPSKNPSTPLKEFQIGAMRLTVWENESESGRSYYRTNLHKLYRLPESDREKDDPGWRDTGSFAPEDLPVIAELCRLATGWLQRQLCLSRNSA